MLNVDELTTACFACRTFAQCMNYSETSGLNSHIFTYHYKLHVILLFVTMALVKTKLSGLISGQVSENQIDILVCV